MNRRQLLKLLASGVVGHTLDIDRLLWIPGQKKIFIPSGLSISQILALEYERILPKIRTLFERDDIFYLAIKRTIPLISTREIRIPLIIEPGNIDWGKDESNKRTIRGNMGMGRHNRANCPKVPKISTN